MSAAPRGGALVTGAAKRVGRTLSLALAKAGYAVAVHYRGGEADAQALVDDIKSQGGRAAAVHADLDAPNAAADLIARAREAVGPLSLLVNNASHFEDDRLDTLTRESWDAHLQPNLWAPVALAQAFAAHQALDASETGDAGEDPQIVNILDQRVLRPNPQFFSYTISKAALYAATGTMAQALAPRIRVNGIAPGPTLASIHQAAAAFDAEIAAVPLQRGSPPDQLAAALLYLIDAKAVTGQTLAVDGGQHLGWKTPDIVGD